MHISESQHKAAGELVDLVADRVGSNRAVHSATAIACAARLAGSMLLRSFNLDLRAVAPGTIVLSNEANEQGPQLIGIVSAMLQHFGIHLDPDKLGGNAAQRGEEPRLSVMQSLELLQNDALRIATGNGLEPKATAHAAAVATAFMVMECAKSIGAEVGFNIAAYGFIEGCKTAPPLIEAP